MITYEILNLQSLEILMSWVFHCIFMVMSLVVLHTPTQLLLPPGATGLNCLRIIHCRLLCRSNCFMNRVINDWNSLPK